MQTPNLFTLQIQIRHTSYKDIVVKFEGANWLTAIPLLTYAFIWHQGLASLTHPIKQKRYLGYLTAAMFISAITCYMMLGVVVPLWFKASVQEIITLNFVSFALPCNRGFYPSTLPFNSRASKWGVFA